jgi:hypothetical protein
MRIELNYKAETFEEAICQTIVAYLGNGMPPREILDQLIARGFVRNPGNNALEVVIQRWTVLKTSSIGSISDSIGLDGFGAKACGDSQGFSILMIG